MRDIKNEQPLVQAYQWEQQVKGFLNKAETWNRFFALPKTDQENEQLQQLNQAWQQHQPFQWHSSSGLIFLLYMIVEYQRHFAAALRELQKKQKKFFKFSRIPEEIARAYEQFLTQQIICLRQLHTVVIDAMLLRLKAASDQQDVTDDHVPSYIIRGLQRTHCLRPTYPVLRPNNHLDFFIFNQLHQAIESRGNLEQKQKLYQLNWYQPVAGMGIVSVNSTRLLAPTSLTQFVPQKVRWPTWLFSDKACLDFFETRRQFFADVTFSTANRHYKLASLSLTHPFIQKMLTHYQLAKEEEKTIEEEKIPWWQFNRKKLQQTWQPQLSAYLKGMQDNFIAWIDHLYEATQIDPDLLQDRTVRYNLWIVINRLSSMMSGDLDNSQQDRLTQIIQRLTALLKQDPVSEWMDILDTVCKNPSTVSITQKEYLVDVIEQMRARDSGLAQEKQITTQFYTLYGDKLSAVLLPQIKAKLLECPDIESLIFDIRLLAHFANEPVKQKLATYIDKLVIQQSASMSDPQLANRIFLIAIQYGSPAVKEHFQSWSHNRIQGEWSTFKQSYHTISKTLAAYYTQKHVEKSCDRLDVACDEKLTDLAQHDPDKLRIYRRVAQRLIDHGKHRIADVELEAHEAIAKSKEVKKTITLKARLPIVKMHIQEADTLEAKQEWQDALIETTQKKLPEKLAVVTKCSYRI
jgi:hypothetical protein